MLIKICVIIIGASFFINTSLAEAATSGPNNPATGADGSSVGTITWFNTDHIFSSNNSYATAGLDDNEISHYLKATNFGFSIPLGATINGITAEIEKKSSNGSRIKDYRVRIIKGGAIGAIDKAKSSWWGTQDAYTAYGSSSDLWGESWTYSDINNANFGVAISAYKNATSGYIITASIDHIRITVTYTTNLVPNAPTLVLPVSGSTTNDNTPTLSANYSDPDIGDTGTTNYRIATSAANCLAGLVVTSGTSPETSSNNQNTTWAPGSSIGSDATYYWCAQNNDGVLISSWTSMGNFILDTIGPTLSFIDNVAAGPVISDTIVGSWSDALVKKWDYDADGICSTAADDYTKTEADSMNQVSEINNTKYICLYAEDVLGNKSTLVSVNDINIDTNGPIIAITAPTKVSSPTITDTTIHIADNNAVVATDVVVDVSTTAGYANFNCSQTDSKTVDCTIDIVSSGNLVIKAVDYATNQSIQAENGYIVSSVAPVIIITAPDKISNTNITSTTINAVDSDGVQAANVTIDASTTASYSSFNCVQTDANTVNCTITINSSGNLVIKAIDNLTNSITQPENNYIIDVVAPVVTITAPTKTSNASVTDTTIHASDDIGILFVNVTVDGATTANTSHFNCVQTDLKTVDCTIRINSSGNLVIRAMDNATNIAIQAEGGYLVDFTPPSVPGIPQATVGTNLTSQDWSWAASTDTGLGVKQYDWRIDGGPSGTTIDTTVATNLTPGIWKFYVKAQDNAGNQSAESSSILSVLSSSVRQVVIDCSAPLIQVIAPDGISDPYLDLSPIIALNEELLEANVSCELHLKTLLPTAAVIVDIPAGATIEGPASTWSDRILIPPILTTAPALLPAGGQALLAIMVGHTIAPLEITKGVRILLEGQANKKIGYVSNNVFSEITSTCVDDSQVMGDSLLAGSNCKVDSGSDLVIWSKHLSDFITYTVNPLAGGSISGQLNPPQAPVTDSGVLISSNIESTASSTVGSSTIALKSTDQADQNPAENFLSRFFALNLKFGQASANVKWLQIFLNQYPDTQLVSSGIGSPGQESAFFGPLTRAALIKFQEKFASEILTPLGLKKGTGFCGEYTRAKIIKILGL